MTLNTVNTGKPILKTCTKCKEPKPLTSYRKCWGRSSDGLKPLCVTCQRAYEMDWRAKNKDRLKQARKNRKKKNLEYQIRYNKEDWARYTTSRLKPRCLKRGIPFDLDQHLGELNQRYEAGICELTGLPFRQYLWGKRTWDSASIHRVNPTDGYIYSNVQVVCFAVNAAIGDWGEEAFTMIASAYLMRKI